MPVGYSASASSAASGQQSQTNGYDFGSGQVWNVNTGGSGTSYQGQAASTSAIKPWMIAAAMVAVYLIAR